VPPVLLATLVLSSGTAKTVTLTLAQPAPPGGLCVMVVVSNPAVATVPAEVCIAEGQQTVAFAVSALAAGEALIAVTAGSEVIQLSLLVDRTLAILGSGLAAPVGSYVTPTTEVALALIVGVFVTPTAESVLAPIIGVEVR